MATPYIKNDGVNYKIQAGLPSTGVATLQFTDSASSTVVTVPNLTGTMALTTINTGSNALVTTDMAAAFRSLDGLVMPNVLGYLTNTPPASPADGDCYIIGPAPTGAWAGQGGKVARYSTIAGGWEFFTPKNGWMLQANSARESYRYTGSAWEIYYQEGTWSPSAVSLGGTGIIISARFTKVGNRSDFGVFISGTGITSTGNLTSITLPFTPTVHGACPVTDTSVNNYGPWLIYTSGKVYLPTIASTPNILLTGTAFT